MKTAKGIIDRQQAFIDQLVSPPICIPKSRKSVIQKGSWFRIVAADIHAAHKDDAALAAFFGDVEQLKPRELFILGDFLSCDGFLAEHHVMNYQAQTEYSYADEIHVGNQILDKLSKHVKRIKIWMGNHERRIETWCITIAKKAGADSKFVLDALMKMFAAENVLSLEKRGIEFLRQGETEAGCEQPGVSREGKSLYMHTGFERGAAGLNAGQKHLNRFAANVAAAHTHINMMITTTVGGSGETITYRNPGCLCKKQQLYSHSEPSSWTHGYTLEVCKDDGTFLAIQIPIVDGKSMLSDLVYRLQ
jgi:hypothetical protein